MRRRSDSASHDAARRDRLAAARRPPHRRAIIVGLDADLVIAGGNGGTPPDAIAKLRSLKVPVLVVYAPDVDTVYHDITLTGDAVGEPAKAADLVGQLKAQFDAVAKATAGATK